MTQKEQKLFNELIGFIDLCMVRDRTNQALRDDEKAQGKALLKQAREAQ